MSSKEANRRRKRRIEREIKLAEYAEARHRRERKKTPVKIVHRDKVYLSEFPPEVVRRVIELVKGLEL